MAENECGMQRNLNLLNEYCNCNGGLTPKRQKLWYLQGLRQGFVICQHLNLAIWILIWLMTMFIRIFVLIGIAHSLKLKNLLHDKASKAMYSLIQKGRRLKLPTDIMLKLFDSCVAPILLYGCEMWGL